MLDSLFPAPFPSDTFFENVALRSLFRGVGRGRVCAGYVLGRTRAGAPVVRLPVFKCPVKTTSRGRPLCRSGPGKGGALD